MDRITGKNYITVDAKRKFTDGPPGTCILSRFLNAIQEEVIHVYESEGDTPSFTDLNQLLNTVKSIASAIFDPLFAVDTGVANSYALTFTPAIAYVDSLLILFKASNANTGASTVNINGMGARYITQNDGSILLANDILANTVYMIIYNEAKQCFQLVNTSGTLFSTRGYFGGGWIIGSIIAEIDGIQFSDESAINPTATLSAARWGLAGINSYVRGYFGGGYDPATAEIDGIQFSDESAINPAATLSVARWNLSGVNSCIRGYFGGGTTGSSSAEIDGIQFSDESAINPAATLSVARYYVSGVNSYVRGYFAGGDGPTAEIDGIQFSDESAINPVATLSVARSGVGSIQSGGIL